MIVYVWVGVNVVRWCAYDHHNSALGCAHRCAGASVRLGCAHEYWLWKEKISVVEKKVIFHSFDIIRKKTTNNCLSFVFMSKMVAGSTLILLLLRVLAQKKHTHTHTQRANVYKRMRECARACAHIIMSIQKKQEHLFHVSIVYIARNSTPSSFFFFSCQQ